MAATLTLKMTLNDWLTATNEEMSKAMDPEVDAFSEWMRTQNQDPLVPSERTMIKTYLAWKLQYEKAEG